MNRYFSVAVLLLLLLLSYQIIEPRAELIYANLNIDRHEIFVEDSLLMLSDVEERLEKIENQLLLLQP